jgi:hypothetical protein
MGEIIQFSISGENKEGVLANVIQDLAYGGVNIRSIIIVDRGEQGEIRIVTDDPVKTERIFKETGVPYEKESLIAVKMPDQPGALHRVASILASNSINIDYIYPLLATTQNATICFKTKDIKNTIDILEHNDIPT